MMMRMTSWLSVTPSSASEMISGMRAKDITHDSAAETPTRSMTMAVVRAASSRMPRQVLDLERAVGEAQHQAVHHRDGRGLGGGEPAGEDAADDDDDHQQRGHGAPEDAGAPARSVGCAGGAQLGVLAGVDVRR